MDKLQLQKEFDTLFSEWEKIIQDPKVRFSSRPKDYIENEPYRKIVKLGKDALPFVIAKLEQGVFLLNQAIEDISGTKTIEIIGKDKRFLSEQEKSNLILKWWNSRKE